MQILGLVLQKGLENGQLTKIRETRFAQTNGFLNVSWPFSILRSAFFQKWPGRTEEQGRTRKTVPSVPCFHPFDPYGNRRPAGWKQAFLA